MENALDELIVKKEQPADPIDITKQMLVTCRIFRKKSSNVTPLKSNRAATGGIAKRVPIPSISSVTNRLDSKLFIPQQLD